MALYSSGSNEKQYMLLFKKTRVSLCRGQESGWSERIRVFKEAREHR